MNLDLLYEINGTRSKMLINEQASIVTKLRRLIPKGVDSELDDIIKRIDNPRQGVNSLSPAQMTKVIQSIPPKKVADVVLTQVLDQTTLKGISDNFVSQIIGGTKTWEEVTTQLQGGRGTMFNMFPNGVPSELLNVSDEVIKGIEKNIKDNLEQTSPDVYKKIFGNVVSDTLKKGYEKFKSFWNSNLTSGWKGRFSQKYPNFMDGWTSPSSGKRWKQLANIIYSPKSGGIFPMIKFRNPLKHLSPEEQKKVWMWTFSGQDKTPKEIFELLKKSGLKGAAGYSTGLLLKRYVSLCALLAAYEAIVEYYRDNTGKSPNEFAEDEGFIKMALMRFSNEFLEELSTVENFKYISPVFFLSEYVYPELNRYGSSILSGNPDRMKADIDDIINQVESPQGTIPSTLRTQASSAGISQSEIKMDSNGNWYLSSSRYPLKQKSGTWLVSIDGSWYKLSDISK
jgi:hypothetical protein